MFFLSGVQTVLWRGAKPGLVGCKLLPVGCIVSFKPILAKNMGKASAFPIFLYTEGLE